MPCRIVYESVPDVCTGTGVPEADASFDTARQALADFDAIGECNNILLVETVMWKIHTLC